MIRRAIKSSLTSVRAVNCVLVRIGYLAGSNHEGVLRRFLIKILSSVFMLSPRGGLKMEEFK